MESNTSLTNKTTSMTRKYTMEKLNAKNVEINDESNPQKSTINQCYQRYIITTCKWKIIYLHACIELVMHLTDEQIDLVKDLETSKEIWDALKERHEPSDRKTKINTLRHLVTLEMEESEGIHTFIRKWQLAPPPSSKHYPQVIKLMKI